MYYYFWNNKRIIESVLQLPTKFNPSLTELTQEQVEFYLANPTATVQEVMNCALTPPYVPPPTELEDLKSSALSELRDAYCLKMARYSELDVAMALASQTAISNIWLTSLQTPYSLNESKDIIKGFCTLGKTCKAIYEEYAKDIDSSSTEEDVASALQSGKEAFDGIE